MLKNDVAVAVSGGIDSSMAAFFVKLTGIEAEAVFMQNWEDLDDIYNCSIPNDFKDAQDICNFIGMKLRPLNFAAEYWDRVFSVFIEKLKLGLTPNPDILCNKHIKFGICLDAIKRILSKSKLVTGHYAKIDILNKKYVLKKAKDKTKDQTYFLYSLSSDQLSQIEFPLGRFYKKELRFLASKIGLKNANKSDSMGICFIGQKNYSQFISKYIKPKRGFIKDINGNILGEHNGAHLFTIGQRKGLNIGYIKGYDFAPWYVAEKSIASNEIFLTQNKNHPLLIRNKFKARYFQGSIQLDELPHFNELKVKIRNQGIEVACKIDINGSDITITTETPIWAVTAGQSAVFYHNDFCLGGAIIL